MLGDGAEVVEVARALEVSEQTLHRWRAQYGGMKARDVQRLRELERENARLRRIVAAKELEAGALREVAKGTGELGPERGGATAAPTRGSAGRAGH